MAGSPAGLSGRPPRFAGTPCVRLSIPLAAPGVRSTARSACHRGGRGTNQKNGCVNAHQRQEALARREAGETLMNIARSYGVSHPTIMRL